MVSNGTLVGSRMSRFSLTGELWCQSWYIYNEKSWLSFFRSFSDGNRRLIGTVIEWKMHFIKNCANRAHAHSRPPQVVWQVCGWWSQHGSSKTPSENCISLPNRSKFDRFSEQNLSDFFIFFSSSSKRVSGPLFLFSGLPTVPRRQIHVF